VKIILKWIGGRSPAIMIIGESEDLIQLGATIQKQAEIALRDGDIDTEIPVDGASVIGEPLERLSLMTVKNIELHRDANKSASRWDKLIWAGIILFVLSMLFFTFQGIGAVFFGR
jgi:hypothetical protein